MPELCDLFGRRIDYLRVSVTDRCNYRCFYCIPSNDFVLEERSEFLSYEELTRLIRLFAELGISHVRLTGGEPLVRRGLVDWVDRLKQLPGISRVGAIHHFPPHYEQGQRFLRPGVQSGQRWRF